MEPRTLACVCVRVRVQTQADSRRAWAQVKHSHNGRVCAGGTDYLLHRFGRGC